MSRGISRTLRIRSSLLNPRGTDVQTADALDSSSARILMDRHSESRRMNTLQESLSSKHFTQEFAESVRTRWGKRTWFKAGLSRWSPRRDSSSFARALPEESPLPATRCGTCHYFRSDPAWVAGVFSGFPGLCSRYASACAANGVCRLSHRLRSAAFKCDEFRC
jgi:hypothetical protein